MLHRTVLIQHRTALIFLHRNALLLHRTALILHRNALMLNRTALILHRNALMLNRTVPTYTAIILLTTTREAKEGHIQWFSFLQFCP